VDASRSTAARDARHRARLKAGFSALLLLLASCMWFVACESPRDALLVEVLQGYVQPATDVAVGAERIDFRLPVLTTQVVQLSDLLTGLPIKTPRQTFRPPGHALPGVAVPDPMFWWRQRGDRCFLPVHYLVMDVAGLARLSLPTGHVELRVSMAAGHEPREVHLRVPSSTRTPQGAGPRLIDLLDRRDVPLAFMFR
jgi:hypothetical protein